MEGKRVLILSNSVLLSHESWFVLQCPYLIGASLITDLGEFLTIAHQHQGWLHNAMALHVSSLGTSGFVVLFSEICNTRKGSLTFVEYLLCLRISSKHYTHSNYFDTHHRVNEMSLLTSTETANRSLVLFCHNSS